MNWQDTRVSADTTHHIINGRPLYEGRFLEVLKFHAPGLAPALSEDGATHIDLSGRPVYSQRFTRTFGFYQDRSAVESAGGWFHILPNGEAAYDDRHHWCGNFQGGWCPVRTADGRYRHISPDGRPLSDGRWAYAGDFRDGVAVVQGADGLSSHINEQGVLVHAQWFVDLDVFHKGFARARDELGWMHINSAGLPIYTRRFASVEPFYNGQARVELEDGTLEVVDERGLQRARLRPPRQGGL